MKGSAALAALVALPLAGCLTVATINVDGQRAATYVVPFGGVSIARGDADAVEIRALALGVVHACEGWTLGAVICRDTHAEPSSNVAIFNGRYIGRLTSHSPVTPRGKNHAPSDPVFRSAGADR